MWSSSIATTGMATWGGWTETTTYANSKTLIETKDRFGRLTARTDLGTNAFTYSYDKAGRMTAQGGYSGLDYSWHNTGLIAEISIGSSNYTRYGYDADGRKTAELTHRGGVEVQDATATYDAMGRLASWTESGGSTPAASLTYQYDLASNVRATSTTYRTITAAGSTSGPNTLEEWYLYDSVNRVVRARADRNSTTTVLSGGTVYSYNVAGQRVTSSTYDGNLSKVMWRARVTANSAWSYHDDNPETPIDPDGTIEDFTHTYGSQVLETYSYNADGTLASIAETKDLVYGNGFSGIATTSMGLNFTRATFSYDAMGRQTGQVDKNEVGAALYDRSLTYNVKGQVTAETTYTVQYHPTVSQLWKNTVTHDYGTGTGYALGAALETTSVDAKFNGSSYTTEATVVTDNTYAWHDGAVLSSLSAVKTFQNSTTSTSGTVYTLDGMGRTTAATITDARSRTVTYTSDMTGQIIRRIEDDGISGNGDPNEYTYRFDGREMGRTGNNGGGYDSYGASVRDREILRASGTGAFRHGATTATAYARFAPNLEGVTTYNQGAGGGAYTVRSGDTLSSIATMLWGNADLWYKIAEANGLSGDAGLAEGRTLTIPAGVLSNAHNASTFKPYDAADALGDTSPISPNPTAQGKKVNKCGAFGAILRTVVAVGVTVATGGALTAALGPVLGGIVTGATASIASQAFGVATGIQDKFNWKAVGMAAITGGVSGGVGGIGIPGAPQVVSQFATGALVNAATQGVAIATGLQHKFDFAGVAVAGLVSAAGGIANRTLARAGVGARFSSAASQARTPGNVLNQAGAGLAGALAGAAGRSIATGSSFGDNLMGALPDVIGSTIGNGLALMAGTGGGAARAGTGGPHEPVKGGASKQTADVGQASANTDGPIVVTGIRQRPWLQRLLSGVGDLLNGRPFGYSEQFARIAMSINGVGRSQSAAVGQASANMGGVTRTLRGTLSGMFAGMPSLRDAYSGPTFRAGIEARINGSDRISATIDQNSGIERALAQGLGAMATAPRDIGAGVLASPAVMADDAVRSAVFAVHNPRAAAEGMIDYATTPSRWFEGPRENLRTGNAFGIGIDGGMMLSSTLGGPSVNRMLINRRGIPTSVDDIMQRPEAIFGQSAEAIAEAYQNAGYSAEVRSGRRGSGLSRIVVIGGHREIGQVQAHPGGGMHRGPYVKISTSTQGMIRIVDPSYVPGRGERATLITIGY